MRNAKSLAFVITSLTFLVSAAISQGFEAFALDEPKHPNWGEKGDCYEVGDSDRLRCCWTEPDLYNPGETVSWCQTCDSDGTNCGPAEFRPGSRAGPDVIAPPPSGVAPPPPTGTCPENTALDAQGNCAPLTQGPLETSPSTEEIVPPSDSVGPLQGGILEQLKQGEGPQQGFFEQQQQPPADQLPPMIEGSPPDTVGEEQPVPVCQEGLEFSEDLGFCVPDCPEGQVLDEESGICVLEEQPAAAEEAEEQQQQTEEEQQPAEEEDGSDNSNN